MVAHAGSVGLRLLADRRLRLRASTRVSCRRTSFTPRHDRGRVLIDVAMLADGGEAITDIDVLRHQAQVLGPVASAPTLWRTLHERT